MATTIYCNGVLCTASRAMNIFVSYAEDYLGIAKNSATSIFQQAVTTHNPECVELISEAGIEINVQADAF